MNAQELGEEDTELIMLLPGISNEVVQEFQDCLSTPLSSINCDRLLEMINQFPAELFLKTFDVKFSRSALHVAVLKGSQTLIDAMVAKLKALSSGNNSKLVEHEFIIKVDEFGLSAANMAVANKEIISCFEQIFGYGWAIVEYFTPFCQSPTSEEKKRNLLEEAFPLLEKQAPSSSDQGVGQLSIREWLLNNNVDFVYCLHEAAMNKLPSQKKALEFVEFVCDNGDSSFLEPLFSVRDSFGKSPLHVHDYEPSNHMVLDFKPLFARLVAHFPNLDFNMRDFSGRTPLHWAAAQGFVDVVKFLVWQKGTDLNATYGNFYSYKTKKSTIFNNVGNVSNLTPLHLAVIHSHIEVVEVLVLKVPKRRGLDINAICSRNTDFFDDVHDKFNWSWTPFQLAAYMGHEQILQVFLKDPRLYDSGLKNRKVKAPKQHNMVSALHLAASRFHPSAVKALVDSKQMDIFANDKDVNTALHYAASKVNGRLQVPTNLNDYVVVPHFTSKPPKSRKPSDNDIKTCIDKLMQLGLDMEQRNKNGMTPTLHPSCPGELQDWWIQKMAKEAHKKKENLIIAANAISVTAALVATTSFVGPLQPPLGLFDDGKKTWLDGYNQVKHTSVQVFLFCDSLSFYLAIAAIVLAMLPSWPIPHEGFAQEVRIARRCVQVAVLLLFGSIIFVICAFSAASIAIVPNHQWQYKTIVVISTSLGVLICFLVLFLSFMRLLTLLSSRNGVAKRISNVATRIMLCEADSSVVYEDVTKSIG